MGNYSKSAFAEKHKQYNDLLVKAESAKKQAEANKKEMTERLAKLEANAEEDKKRREAVEARNQAEALMHSTEKTLSEHGDKVSEADKSAIETAIEDLRAALESEDKDEIEAKSQILAQASMKLGEAMYAAQQAEGEEAPETGVDGEPVDDDVVDADFEEVSDDDGDEKKSA